jgi:hypothetical protein
VSTVAVRLERFGAGGASSFSAASLARRPGTRSGCQQWFQEFSDELVHLGFNPTARTARLRRGRNQAR